MDRGVAWRLDADLTCCAANSASSTLQYSRVQGGTVAVEAWCGDNVAKRLAKGTGVGQLPMWSLFF